MSRTRPPLNATESAVVRRLTERVRERTVARLREPAMPDGPQNPATVTIPVILVREMQESIDASVGTAIGGGAPLACEAGCSHCCHARVEALVPEILLIAEHVCGLPGAARELLQHRIDTHLRAEAQAAGQDADRRPLSERPACPFLLDDLCSIYPIRPGVCRRAHSLSRAACAEGAPEIPQSLQIALSAQGLIDGTAQGLAETGLDAGRYELVAALSAVLAEPALGARWAAGDVMFPA